MPIVYSIETSGNYINLLLIYECDESKYKVVQIWQGQTVTCLHTVSPGHIWTTLYVGTAATSVSVVPVPAESDTRNVQQIRAPVP
jgi:hypothetical protein